MSALSSSVASGRARTAPFTRPWTAQMGSELPSSVRVRSRAPRRPNTGPRRRASGACTDLCPPYRRITGYALCALRAGAKMLPAPSPPVRLLSFPCSDPRPTPRIAPQVFNTNTDALRTLREISILRQCHHPNILTVKCERGRAHARPWRPPRASPVRCRCRTVLTPPTRDFRDIWVVCGHGGWDLSRIIKHHETVQGAPPPPLPSPLSPPPARHHLTPRAATRTRAPRLGAPAHQVHRVPAALRPALHAVRQPCAQGELGGRTPEE